MTAVRLTACPTVLTYPVLLQPSPLYYLRYHHDRRTWLASPQLPPRALCTRGKGQKTSHRRIGTDSKRRRKKQRGKGKYSVLVRCETIKRIEEDLSFDLPELFSCWPPFLEVPNP